MPYIYLFHGQTTELQVNHANFSADFIDLVFKEEYRAIRAWPSTTSRSDKPKAPMELKNFLHTYIAKHVQDKMSAKLFKRR